ncbi:MAG: Fic family protein [Patescibacteria group bacterium]
MSGLLKKITEKQKKVQAHRPFPRELINDLDGWFKIELTYTSNAIEGNTLTRQETALVVEKGLTVAGKSLTEHLEAMNHAHALEYIKKLVRKKRADITEKEILDIHRIILSRIDDANAGRYRNVPVRIAGSTVIMPNPLKVPDLMSQFMRWMHRGNAEHPATIAADAHLKFVSIHPFIDGNGRTARLLMNLLLMQKGYPPALVRKEDRLAYINAIEQAQLHGEMDDYYRIIYRSIERSLDIYLKAVGREDPASKSQKKTKLLKIGELARATGESVATIRFWTEEELLEVEQYTESGYALYASSMIERVNKIRRLQKEKRLTIAEVKVSLKNS